MNEAQITDYTREDRLQCKLNKGNEENQENKMKTEINK